MFASCVSQRWVAAAAEKCQSRPEQQQVAAIVWSKISTWTQRNANIADDWFIDRVSRVSPTHSQHFSLANNFVAILSYLRNIVFIYGTIDKIRSSSLNVHSINSIRRCRLALAFFHESSVIEQSIWFRFVSNQPVPWCHRKYFLYRIRSYLV